MGAEERHELAVHAARTRWSRKRRKHLAQLRQIGESALKAHTELLQEIRALKSTRTVELEHHLRRLIGAFYNLWDLDGHTLPPEAHAYITGAVVGTKAVETAKAGKGS